MHASSSAIYAKVPAWHGGHSALLAHARPKPLRAARQPDPRQAVRDTPDAARARGAPARGRRRGRARPRPRPRPRPARRPRRQRSGAPSPAAPRSPAAPPARRRGSSCACADRVRVRVRYDAKQGAQWLRAACVRRSARPSTAPTHALPAPRGRCRAERQRGRAPHPETAARARARWRQPGSTAAGLRQGPGRHLLQQRAGARRPEAAQDGLPLAAEVLENQPERVAVGRAHERQAVVHLGHRPHARVAQAGHHVQQLLRARNEASGTCSVWSPQCLRVRRAGARCSAAAGYACSWIRCGACRDTYALEVHEAYYTTAHIITNITQRIAALPAQHIASSA